MVRPPAGASPSGKAVDFDSTIPRFESWRPSQPYPLCSECCWQAVIDWFDFRSQDAELRASGKGRPVHDLQDSPESRFLGIRLPDAREDLLQRTNPLTYLRQRLPPFLIQHGSDDDLVPVEQSMLLARALREVLPETDVRFDVIPGSLQGGPAFETEENMARVFAFLSAALAPFRQGCARQGELSA